jgi:hypothetical protein
MRRTPNATPELRSRPRGVTPDWADSLATANSDWNQSDYLKNTIAAGSSDDATRSDCAKPLADREGANAAAAPRSGIAPDNNERANATHYKLSGFDDLLSGGGSVKTAIENAISQGEPVAFGMDVRQSFNNLVSDPQLADSYSYLPATDGSDPSTGEWHEMTIVAYNEQGVKIENSWGGSFGDNGFFTVPWGFFDTGDVNEINAVGKLVQS